MARLMSFLMAWRWAVKGKVGSMRPARISMTIFCRPSASRTVTREPHLEQRSQSRMGSSPRTRRARARVESSLLLFCELPIVDRFPPKGVASLVHRPGNLSRYGGSIGLVAREDLRCVGDLASNS